MAVRKRKYSCRGRDRDVWYYQFMLAKRRYVESGFTTQKEATEAERRKINELRSKRNRPVPLGYVGFEQWVPKLLEHRATIGKSFRTVENERRRAIILSRTFGNLALCNMTVADIQAYVAERVGNGISSRTINLEMSFLRTLFRHAVENGAAETNPAREIPHLPSSGEKEEVWIPTEEEFHRVIEAARTLSTAEVFVPWLYLRAYSGLRPSESVFLTWDDLDFDGGLIWVRPKAGNPVKNRRKRRVPMHAELRPVLLRWRDEWCALQTRHQERWHKGSPGFEHDWVFIHPRNHDERTDCFRRSLYMVRKMAGLPRLTSYSLRHYFASRCIASKIDLFTISRWMGHKNTKMVEEIYGHLTEDRSAVEMKKLFVMPEGTSAVKAQSDKGGQPESVVGNVSEPVSVGATDFPEVSK